MSDNEWVEEFFYFGNAMYPSDATYRRKGSILEKRYEFEVFLTPVPERDNIYKGDFENYEDFLKVCHDITVSVINNRNNRAPSLYLLGWVTIDTPEGLARYEEDKKYG